MRQLVLVMLCLAVAGPGIAQGLIGIFADDVWGSECHAPIEEYVPMMVHVMAVVPDIDAVTAAEFRIANYPGNPGYPIGSAYEYWNSDLIIGDITWDFSIAFSEPQPGPLIHLGSIEFTMFDPTWILDDWIMTVGEGADCECLVVVDADFEIVDVMGGQFTFNCTDPSWCYCSWFPTATHESSWSAIKQLF